MLRNTPNVANISVALHMAVKAAQRSKYVLYQRNFPNMTNINVTLHMAVKAA